MNKQKIVLVTGASGGIGQAIARAFAQEGHAVALGCHENLQSAIALQKEMEQQGRKVMVCKADVTQEQQVEEMFRCVRASYGPVEILVNVAGFAQQKLFDTITAADWDKVMDINAKGTFLCCRAGLPDMIRAKEGCIVNIASMWGQVGASCEVHYSAAKAAVIGLSKALAKEVGPSGIRVNCVSPGAVETAMLSAFSAQDLQALCEETPLQRLGRPQDVAQMVLFLASEKADFITGQVIGVNGGFVI